MPRSNALNRQFDARASALQTRGSGSQIADLGASVSGSRNAPGAMHFFPCGMCGQLIDARQLGEVIYHETPDHEPLAIN
jgi:hypothetical protein